VGWLLVAALALVLLAGWCASAETALLRVSRAGAKELGRSPGEGGGGALQVVLGEISRYLSVLVLIAAIVDAARGGLLATKIVLLACLAVAALMVVAHLVAIMASRRLG